MAYCFERGIPHSVFLSWDQEDRAKTIAYAMEQAARCTKCGTASWEWDEDPFAYVPLRLTCPGCRMLDMSRSDDPAGGTATTVILTKPKMAEELERTPKARPRRRND